MGFVVALAALVVVLVVAIVRPRHVPEAAVAAPLALLLVVSGVLPAAAARSELRELLPVVGFLAAVLVLGQLCEDEGLFAAAGSWMAGASAGSPTRLLTAVTAVAALTTAVLSLDATVVLLTPVVFATAARLGTRARPHVYACTHLANSASLLLPVSNLTNLLAFGAAGVGFATFAGLMAVPWLLVVAVERAAVGRFFRQDLAAATEDAPARESSAGTGPTPRVAVAVVAATLVGFVVASARGVDPAWVAAAGCLALAGYALVRRRVTVPRLLGSANPAFLAFVLALGVVVRAVMDNGLSDAIGHLVPTGASLGALLAVAGLAALLANLVNNLPATLLLLPLLGGHATGPVLAALIGVNVGPNLTYVGSLATLLWRRIVRAHDAEPGIAEYHLLGLVTVPASLVLATTALWAGLALTGRG